MEELKKTEIETKQVGLQDLERKLDLFKFAVSEIEKTLDTTERGASYILSFFGAILPVSILINENAKNTFLKSDFSFLYVILYLLIVISAIGTLFPKKNFRFTQFKFGFNPKSSVENFLDEDRDLLIKFVNAGPATMLSLKNDATVLEEFSSKLSYSYLAILFIYIFVDLSKDYVSGIFYVFSFREIWLLIIFGPFLFHFREYIKEWTILQSPHK